MNRRAAGVCFCAIAAVLFAARYLTAARFGSGVLSWDAGLFRAMLEYVGTPLLTLSILSLVAGIAYLIFSEIKKEK